MSVRSLHRLVGLVLLLPFLGWAATGIVFFVKPGYGGAYEQLSVKTYPLEGTAIVASPDWHEFRLVRTVLGEHLLARTENGWQQLQPLTLLPSQPPAEDALRQLLEDAFTANPARYGRILRVENDTALTDTGVEVRLDWQRLGLQQKGGDTALLDALYRVHYLQWTGIALVDQVLGLLGLGLLILMTLLGARLAL
jgi:hypothetical protein